jgi:hypothetical protein
MCSIDTISSALTAIGTIAVAVLAIWGDWFRSWLAPPRVEIRPHNLRGTVTSFTNGPRVIYYHLKASNTRRWAVARNCRIILTAIYRRGPDQQFRASLVPVPPQFVWAPAELTPIVINLPESRLSTSGALSKAATGSSPFFMDIRMIFSASSVRTTQSGTSSRQSLEVRLSDPHLSTRWHGMANGATT